MTSLKLTNGEAMRAGALIGLGIAFNQPDGMPSAFPAPRRQEAIAAAPER